MSQKISTALSPSSPNQRQIDDLVAQIVGRATLLRDGAPDNDLRKAGDHYFRTAVMLWTAFGFDADTIEARIGLRLAEMRL